MGIMPVNRLLLNMAVPMIVSMLVQALYNVVDSVFVAKLSEDALNAVSLAFPVQNALLSRSLGQKEQDKVDRTAMNGLLLAAISCLVFMLFGLTCGRRFYAIQTDIQTIISYGGDYLTICCGMCFGVFAQITLERILQATGRTFYTMITQATGALINIILDPILIFGLFGFPRMEVAGAALATVIGQICGALLALMFNLRKNTDVHFQLKNLRPSAPVIGGIYSVGVPSIAMQSIGSVMVFGMNQILIALLQPQGDQGHQHRAHQAQGHVHCHAAKPDKPQPNGPKASGGNGQEALGLIEIVHKGQGRPGGHQHKQHPHAVLLIA